MRVSKTSPFSDNWAGLQYWVMDTSEESGETGS